VMRSEAAGACVIGDLAAAGSAYGLRDDTRHRRSSATISADCKVGRAQLTRMRSLSLAREGPVLGHETRMRSPIPDFVR
jgi:hypothetical protein